MQSNHTRSEINYYLLINVIEFKMLTLNFPEKLPIENSHEVKAQHSPEFRLYPRTEYGREFRALSIYLRRVIDRSYGRSIDRPITRSAPIDCPSPYPPVTGNRVYSQLRADHRRL